MPAFTGTLNSNEIFAALYNMIISQQVFADNIAGTYGSLAEKAKVEGTLYGDTKLYYSTDALKSHPWLNDSEASNLLALDRPEAPKVQAITINIFRQIRLTVDNYLSKRAWSTEGAFSEFNGVMMGWIGETKKIYDATVYNAFIGTTKATTGRQAVSIDVTTAVGSTTGEEKNRLTATAIAEGLANLLTDMKDITRDFNDYGQLRSYAEGSIKVIWNSSYVNKIKKIDLPTIFHKDGLVDKFEEEVLPARYFGAVVTSAVTAANNIAANYADHLRSLIETDYTVGGTTTHVFPGDQIPYGVDVAANTAYNHASDKTICKIVVELPPLMSGFETETNFFNPRSLTENHYLTFGHNTLEYLKGKPFITVTEI